MDNENLKKITLAGPNTKPEAPPKNIDVIDFLNHTLLATLSGPRMIIVAANNATMEGWGKGNDVLGKSLFAVNSELIAQGIPEILDKVYETGITFEAREMPIMLLQNGVATTKQYTFICQALHNGAGEIFGVDIVAFEVITKLGSSEMLKESEDRFRSLADNIPIAIFIMDSTKDAKVSYWNQFWLNHTGQKKEDALGFGWHNVIHPDDIQAIIDVYIPAFNSMQPFTLPCLRVKRYDGEYVWFKVQANPHFLPNGKFIGFIGIGFDIHEAKLAEDEIKKKEALNRSASQYARSLIEASLDPLITIDAAGKIMDMNIAMTRTTGVSREVMIGSNFFTYFTEPKKAQKVHKEVFKKGFVSNYPLTIKDHKLTDVLFNGSVYKDEQGKVMGVVVVARDITEQKRIEKELTKAKNTAEQATLVAEIAQGIAEQARLVAEEGVKSKQQFLSNMSHEIRTPLNAIIGFTKVVLRTDLTAKQKEYLMAIKMSGDALIVLINDILDLARVDAGKMVFEKIPFRPSEFISAILHLFEIRTQEKGLKLVLDFDSRIPKVLVGDPVRLHQIILNLLSNAVKFTQHGQITVGVQHVSEDLQKVEIKFSVSDTGIGINEDAIKKIFENFHQATSATSRLFGGTGLGLAIAKKMVEGQSGSIWVESIPDKGSTFNFILKFEKTNMVLMDIKAEEIQVAINTIKVLIVEDIALNQLLMKTILDDFGFQHDIAENGKIAIEKLKTNDYDIILMDLQMPEMNGFQATHFIRNEMKSQIPIIALTADVTTVDLNKCLAVGMDDYIAKPVDEKLLYVKLINLVKKIRILTTEEVELVPPVSIRSIDLNYLNHRTKSNPALMIEMISLYLEQTPVLVKLMRQNWTDKNWESLQSVLHKMLPSFLIVGIHSDYEIMANKVHKYAQQQLESNEISGFILQIEKICNQACTELEFELETIKKLNK